MAKTAQQVYDEITAHIAKQGGAYSGWCCGVTSDIEDRLFGAHKVPKTDHWYSYRECDNSDSARAVEKALIDLGCAGGTGGGDHTTVHVYAYLMTSVTDP